MKRDLDLIREMMLQIEAAPPVSISRRFRLPDHALGDLRYNYELMLEAGFIREDRYLDSMSGGVEYFSDALTNAGHDYLDAIRSETIWSKTKDKLASVGGGAALAAVQAVATGVVNQTLGLK